MLSGTTHYAYVLVVIIHFDGLRAKYNARPMFSNCICQKPKVVIITRGVRLSEYVVSRLWSIIA